MILPRPLFAPVLAAMLAFPALPCAAQASAPPAAAAPDPKVHISAERDSEWNSYRHAYKAAAFFATFTRSRPLIQAHMQIRLTDKTASLEGLTIRLHGEHTDMMLPVDAIGRTVLPMLKEPYQDDAVLRLNRRKGSYYFSGRYSVRERDDGVYQAADLRAACEQLIDAQRASGYRIRLVGKRCTGIRFVYALSENESPVSVQAPGAAPAVLALTEAPAFEGPALVNHKVALYRFGDWPAQGQVLARRRPVAIGTIYE
jgi:hypothetical protein